MPFDATPLPRVAGNLLRAKQYIEEHGWCSSEPERDGTVCVVQAIGLTVGRNSQVTSVQLYAKAIGLPRAELVPIWNDTPGRTLEEVYEGFDKAIALAIAE